jgi:hypothetical protein
MDLKRYLTAPQVRSRAIFSILFNQKTVQYFLDPEMPKKKDYDRKWSFAVERPPALNLRDCATIFLDNNLNFMVVKTARKKLRRF